MRAEPHWITADRVIYLNKRIVAASGEPYGLRSESLLISACARPQQVHAYAEFLDMADMACALLFGIARNHPFVQGNKRTGFYAMIALLVSNGFEIDPLDDISYGDAITRVLVGNATEAQFTIALREVIRPATD